MASSQSREFDILIWGVTGYTGQLVAKVCATRHADLKIAFGGRSEERLHRIREKMLRLRSQSASGPEYAVLAVDLHDSTAVEAMCSRTHVVIATAGPFTEIGEPIVRGCAASGTDYVDITGEVAWVHNMRSKYDGLAKKNKAKILPCCGFDYIPNDVGVFYLQHYAQHVAKMTEPIGEIEQVLEQQGSKVSSGTLKSILVIMSHMSIKDVLTSAKKVGPYEACGSLPDDLAVRQANADRMVPYQSTFSGKWLSPNVMTPGMKRYILWANEAQNFRYGRNFVFRPAAGHQSVWSAMREATVTGVGAFIGFLISRCACTRRLISGSGTGPDPETLNKNGNFVQVMTTGCIKSKRTDSNQTREGEAQDYKKVSYVMRFNKGEAYALTGYTAAETAVCCLNARKAAIEVPGVYGVTSPTAALGTALIDQLTKAGFEFKLTEG